MDYTKKILKGKLVKVKDLQVGDIFCHNSTMEVGLIFPTYLPNFNIVVTPSVTEEYLNKGMDFAFNSVSLVDGRVRTFHPEAHVFVYNKAEIFIH